ncbi:MAG TPA: CBS domain-containing protein [Thermoanaerobaculia bacterium]|nr:CBS domain-containing protein [Thermoanaerobaculia bacterium]
MRPITAADLMNPEVLTVPEDMTVRELAGFLMDNEITGAPVVNREGRLVGVVSVVDIADAAAGEEEGDGEGSGQAPPREGFHAAGFGFGEGLAPDALGALGPLEEAGEMRVGEIMNPEFYSVPEDATVSQVATTMLNNHVHRLLVIEEGKVAGIITTSDLLGLLVDES